MDWQTISSNRGRGNRERGRGRRGGYTSQSSTSNYPKYDNPVIQQGRKTLINESITNIGNSSGSNTINLDNIPKDSSLYEQIQAYMTAQKEAKGNTYANILSQSMDSDDMQNFEKMDNKEIIFLVENDMINWSEDPYKILNRYLTDKLYYPGQSYKTPHFYEALLQETRTAEISRFKSQSGDEFNFSKIIVKKIISLEEWGLSSMKEKPILAKDIKINATYWDYIQAFSNILFYNNSRKRHTWFIKICPYVFTEKIPNWFLNWWSYHGPSTKILPSPFKELFYEWKQLSPDMDKLYKQNHISYPAMMADIMFFIKYSIPWIHKWNVELGYTPEQIPCIQRIYYNHFWDKMLKTEPKEGKLYSQDTINCIEIDIQSYKEGNKTILIEDDSLKYVARKIEFQGGDKEKMIADYLEQVKKNLLMSIGHIPVPEPSSSSSNKSSDDMYQDSQIAETPDTQELLETTEEWVRKMKNMDKAQGKKPARD